MSLWSGMLQIYVYCQGPAYLTTRALDVFETMLEKNVKPDAWAAAGTYLLRLR
jgi:hypothetical protein